jgi:hypothetical protein
MIFNWSKNELSGTKNYKLKALKIIMTTMNRYTVYGYLSSVFECISWLCDTRYAVTRLWDYKSRYTVLQDL